MPDYSKGKIYTIRCRNDDTLIYVGSTIQPLSKRWGGHKVDSLRYTNMPLYKTINNDWDNWYIELYENISCENKEQLHKREGEVIRDIGTLNLCIAGRSGKEWYKENTEKRKMYREKYRQENPDYFKLYHKENADTIQQKKKQYYQKNADKLKEYQQEYKKNNAEKIQKWKQDNKNKLKEQFKCECGGQFIKTNMSNTTKQKNT
jgi:hypothetical protein